MYHICTVNNNSLEIIQLQDSTRLKYRRDRSRHIRYATIASLVINFQHTLTHTYLKGTHTMYLHFNQTLPGYIYIERESEFIYSTSYTLCNKHVFLPISLVYYVYKAKISQLRDM